MNIRWQFLKESKVYSNIKVVIILIWKKLNVVNESKAYQWKKKLYLCSDLKAKSDLLELTFVLITFTNAINFS